MGDIGGGELLEIDDLGSKGGGVPKVVLMGEGRLEPELMD